MAAQDVLIAVADASTIEVTLVTVVAQIIERAERKVDTGSIVRTAHPMYAKEMAIELIAEPIAELRLYHKQLEQLAVLLFPHHLLPWIIIDWHVQCQLLA